MAHGSRSSFEKRNRERSKRLKRMEKLERRLERRARSREAQDGLPAEGELAPAADPAAIPALETAPPAPVAEDTNTQAPDAAPQ
jgi:hypothetical protein